MTVQRQLLVEGDRPQEPGAGGWAIGWVGRPCPRLRLYQGREALKGWKEVIRFMFSKDSLDAFQETDLNWRHTESVTLIQVSMLQCWGLGRREVGTCQVSVLQCSRGRQGGGHMPGEHVTVQQGR